MIACQRIPVVKRPRQVLDFRKSVAFRFAAGARAVRKAHNHCLGNGGVITIIQSGIDSFAAIQNIRAASARQRVIARTAVDLIVAALAAQAVVPRAAFQSIFA